MKCSLRSTRGTLQDRAGFAVMLTIPVVCTAILFIWSATDASFTMASWSAQAKLGLHEIESSGPVTIEIDPVLKWNVLGSRVTALVMLYIIGVICTVGLIVLAARCVTRRRILACVLILIAWVVLLASRDAVDRWRITRQVTAALPQFQVVTNELRKHWPKKSGEIPPGISFHVVDQYPDVLMVRNYERFPMCESFGPTIMRDYNKGIIRFELAGSYDTCLEFHPNDTKPAPYTSGYGFPSPPVASISRVTDKWFVVRYAGP